MKFMIFASGNGSNVEAIVVAYLNHEIPGELVGILCDQPKAFVIERAKKLDVPYFVVPRLVNESKHAHEARINQILQREQVDFIFLAGYMRIIGPTLLADFLGRIVNLHPSLLPKYPGKQAIQDAFSDQAAETGITIHYVDEGIDTGPIISQTTLAVLPNESLEDLTERIHKIEHRDYPRVIANILGGRE